MRTNAVALLYGHDEQLLKTREWILETIGILCQAETHIRAFEATLRDRSFAVTILCHTVPQDEKAIAIALTHRLQPGMKLLVLEAIPSLQQPASGERTFDIKSGPGMLVRTVQQMVADQGHPTDRKLPRSPEPQVMHHPILPEA